MFEGYFEINCNLNQKSTFKASMSMPKDAKTKLKEEKLDKIATASTNEVLPSSQVWGDDEDYDSEEGDEEFGLSSEQNQVTNSAPKKAQN